MKRFFLLCACIAMGAVSTHAWLMGGHHTLTLAAVQALPDEMPAFFRAGASTVAHMSVDPDVAKHRGTPHVRAGEYPEHFLDREMLDVAELPDNRFDYIKLCYERGVQPEKMGFLPYALTEWTERLAVAFAEYRKWPDNPHIQSKCLIYAGFISHYAQDMCQPLHLTLHYNGRVQEDGSKVGEGIHFKVDGLIETLHMDPEDLAAGAKVVVLDSLTTGIMAEFEKGFALVDRTYELAPNLPDYQSEDWARDADVVAFAEGRARAAVQFTASLYLTAWRMSESLPIADYVRRAEWDNR